MPTEVVTDARSSIAKGSKSFFFASLFFSRDRREDCWALYRWCRHCDDAVDAAGTPEEARRALLDLSENTAGALSGKPASGLFAPLARVYARHGIPVEYARDHIRGFSMDVDGFDGQDLADVEKYSYHVAGVVGLMMAHIMGVTSDKAYGHAVDMGVAMQLTNIARDVREDFANGRVYLPARWLAEAGIDRHRLLDAEYREPLFAVVIRVLDRAEELYRSGFKGLGALPFRSAVAVAIAACVYRAIGREIRRRGAAAIDTRVYTGRLDKWLLAARGLALAVKSRFTRE
ncbi:MAG: phytoene/squalene synthase family protein [Calothrix sp. SM1_5_4]|nr:phytoene/squalene synthase family protein [Calothrix sp. SM1_5_4]